MATIYVRRNKDGSESWRVLFRRKGIPPFCTVFSTKKEAEEWAKENEPMYCLGKLEWDRLKAKWAREFTSV
jgi:hypothetical protein